jgi:hypothetical protein
MGYSTNFIGELKFTSPLTEAEINHLNSNYLDDVDVRDHPDWLVAEDEEYVTYIDLELLKGGYSCTINAEPFYKF